VSADGPIPGLGKPRHGQQPTSRRPGPAWLAGGIAVVVTVVVVGVLVLSSGSSHGPRHSGSGAGAGASPSEATATRSAGTGHGSADSSSARTAGRAVLSVADVGDMNFGMDGRYAPGGPRALLSAVAGDLRSNLTVGNLETALGGNGVTKCAAHSSNCFAFQAPASSAQGVRRAGFAAVNVANNHTDDAGPAGVKETDAALRAADLRWTGRPGQTTYLVRHGIKIALLGFAPYDYDASLLDIPAAAAAVRQAAARAQLVFVFIHAGAEGSDAQHVRPGMETYLGEERGDAIAFSHAVIRAGADLVFGSGPHVLRAMQWYHGRLIAYSLGNFAGYYTLGLGGITADSAILRVRLRADGTFVSGRLIPLRLAGGGSPEPDPSRAAIAIINSLSRSDLGASGVRIAASGRIEPPRR
jgi:hypothetical protein